MTIILAIFILVGPLSVWDNYHSQIIDILSEIIKLFLLENELKEEDIQLIWNCTKRGNIELKLSILVLLFDLAPNFKENHMK